MSTDPFAECEWPLAHDRSLTLGPRGLLMGVLNVTPDSFSDGGQFESVPAAVAQARAMSQQGADIIDVGGESTRPDAEPVNGPTERARILPIISTLAAEGFILSVDTYRAETAEAALQAGAHIVNDVWGAQREPDIARIAAEQRAGFVLMHNSRDREVLPDVIADQFDFLRRSLRLALEAGVERERIVLDPGIGFGKDEHANLMLLDRLAELHALKHPILLGTSRKRFLGAVTGRDATSRDAATAATTALARRDGIAIFRVHALEPNRDAVQVADAIRTGAA